MFSKLTYKQKLRGLGVIALLMIAICYKLAFVATINEYKSYTYHQDNISAGENASNASNIEKRDLAITGKLNRYLLDTLDNEKSLLAVVSAYCSKNSLYLKEYRPMEYKQYDSIHVLTRAITVEGSFINCLKLNYQLEKQNNCGRIGSVLYQSHINARDKSTYLDCTIFMLNITDYERKK